MIYVGIALVVLILVLVLRALMMKPEKINVKKAEECDFDMDKATEHLSNIIKIKTISNSDYSKTDYSEFDKLHKYLEEAFPKSHATLEKEVINGYSLVYKWNGKDSRLKPILLTAHMDVVPIEESTKDSWEHDAFSGDVSDGFVWGRGTLDTKIQISAIFDAIEYLLSKSFTPKRDVYLAFGHDEEIGGEEGAVKMAEHFKSKGIEFEYVLDEGGCTLEGGLKGIDAALASIGIVEKGYANIKLISKGTGGHSSTPPDMTSEGKICKAITLLEKHKPKKKITKPLMDMLNSIGPYMSFKERLVIANLWLLSPAFKAGFSKTPNGNAMLSTTVAPTMMEASMEPNVLPQRATATINFRLLPGETGETLLNYIKKTIKDDSIEIEPLRLEDPSHLSPVDSESFKHLKETIYSLIPDVIVTPYMVMAGTDSRKYEDICKCIYRFVPYRISNTDLKRMHGVNERISIENLKRCINFYINLLK